MRFEKLTRKYGFKIKKVFNRPDILSVQYHNHHIMTIPKKMYSIPRPAYRDILGHQHPDYFACEHRIKNWNLIIKRTPHIQEREKLEQPI